MKIEDAITAHKANDFSKAEKVYLDLLKDNPDDYLALRLLGVLKAQLKDYDQAIELFDTAIALQPSSIEAYLDLNRTLFEIYNRKQSYFDKIIENSLKILEINPSQVEVLTRLAGIYKNDNNFQEAKNIYQKLIELDSGNLDHLNNYAVVLLNLGFSDKAREILLSILDKDENYYMALYNLLTLFKLGDDFQVLRNKAESLYEKLDESQKISLGFALARIYDNEKDYKKAFLLLEKSNQEFRRLHKYNHDQYKVFFDNIQKACDRERFKEKFKDFDLGLEPIFIVGMPRSGTSLVEQIISSHPEVSAAGELHLLPRVLGSYLDLSKTALEERIRDFDSFKQIGEEYVKNISSFAKGKKFLTDKMPSNFSYIGFIKLMIPRAKIIHVKRNPRDTLFSCYRQYFPRGNFYAGDFKDLSDYYQLYSSMMQYWKNTLPEGSFYEIEYERLIKEQEKETRALLNYIGLEWDNACLEFYKSDRVVETASRLQVTQPMNQDSLSVWKKYEEAGCKFDPCG